MRHRLVPRTRGTVPLQSRTVALVVAISHQMQISIGCSLLARLPRIRSAMGVGTSLDMVARVENAGMRMVDSNRRLGEMFR